MYSVGVDIGSTYTKYCIMNDGKIEKLFCEKTPVRQKEYFENKARELLSEYPNASIVSCGYGRRNISSVKRINELTALARGVGYVCPECELVLDIGGQDTKIIRQKNGQLKEFFVNDKCAAGSGIFLSNVLNMLGEDFDSIDLTGAKEPEIHLSSVCAVFAQSEIVEIISKISPGGGTIIEAVIWQIFKKAAPLLDKVEGDEILLSGGLSEIKGIESFASLALGKKVATVHDGRFFAAIGAAVIEFREE